MPTATPAHLRRLPAARSRKAKAPAALFVIARLAQVKATDSTGYAALVERTVYAGHPAPEQKDWSENPADAWPWRRLVDVQRAAATIPGAYVTTRPAQAAE